MRLFLAAAKNHFGYFLIFVFGVRNSLKWTKLRKLVILIHGESDRVTYTEVQEALLEVDTQIRLFGKPQVSGERRMGVCLAMGESVEEARKKANSSASKIHYSL